MKRHILGCALALAASSAQADSQNWWPRAFLGVNEESSQITSGTTINDVDIEHGTTGVNLVISSSVGGISVQVQERNSDGVVLTSQTLARRPCQ